MNELAIDNLYLIAAGVVLVGVGLLMWVMSRRSVLPMTDESDGFDGVSLTPRPVLSDAELSLYNLIKLAVQERYLVFAQIPVRALLAVESADQSARSRLLRKLALRRVDFALVHPGTRTARVVVTLERPDGLTESQRRREQLVGAVLQSAGIRSVRLDPTRQYSVAALADALELEFSNDEAGAY